MIHSKADPISFVFGVLTGTVLGDFEVMMVSTVSNPPDDR